jgi:hypothetical protein
MEDARGRAVFASDGERLGEVEALLEDVETRKPEWLAIGTALGGRERLLVPVTGSETRSDGIYVRYSSDQVRSTPAVEGDVISQETERMLYGHYGLPYSEQRSSTGLPERPERPKRREAPARRRSGGMSSRTSTSDEPTRDELYQEAKQLDIEGRSKMNKKQLARAVEQARGGAGSSGRGRQPGAKANPIEVQKFLEGVGYPARRRKLVEEAKRQRASDEVRSTLERLPEQEFEAPTDVSEAIGRLS